MLIRMFVSLRGRRISDSFLSLDHNRLDNDDIIFLVLKIVSMSLSALLDLNRVSSLFGESR